ncbi:MAG: glycosyltransferase family 39 protein [Nitrososphaera sp.]|nr:glycosyltransferase family 39 protein [Nitrososphaera sp.]
MLQVSKLTASQWLIIIFVAGFLFRAAPIAYLEWTSPGWHSKNINEIEFYYDDVARSVIAGKGFVHSVNPRSSDQRFSFTPGTPFHFVPPLYAWWLSILYFIFGPNVFVAKVIQCVMDAAVAILLFKIAKKAFNREDIGILSGSLYATYPLAIAMCTTLYYQVPLNLALCGLVLCLMAPATPRNGLRTGFVTGISALAKPVTLPLLVILPMIKLAESLRNKHSLTDFYMWCLVFILVAVATLAPWTIRNYFVFHEFVPVQHGGGAAFYQGSKEEYVDLDVTSLRKTYGNFGLNPNEQTPAAIRNHLDHLRERPLDYFRFLMKKFALTWYNTEGKTKNFYALLAQSPYLLIAVFGLLTSLKSWLTKPRWYIPGMVLYICVIQVAIFPLLRYTLAVMPLVMIMTSYGLFSFLPLIVRTSRIESTQAKQSQNPS